MTDRTSDVGFELSITVVIIGAIGARVRRCRRIVVRDWYRGSLASPKQLLQSFLLLVRIYPGVLGGACLLLREGVEDLLQACRHHGVLHQLQALFALIHIV